ncbi:hypothetical protein F4604DRAFT_1915885 [Suillus subluteus]|nr:hypothetical protein F4604DRAFT_1915885 [Suillus subluteus]
MPSAEISNEALNDATAQVMQVIAKGMRLKDGHPNHLRFAMEIGNIMSSSFQLYGISATMVPPILLSAAMEMQEHVDPARQHFVSAPTWCNIRADNPQIQQHPLKDKVRTIVVSMLKPTMQTSATTNADATGNPANAPATVASRTRPKPKPMPRKKKPE